MHRHDLPPIGQPLAGGTYGGIVRIGERLHAVVWAPKADGETVAAWAPDRTDLTAARSCCDSLTNTLAMAEAGSALARWALDLRIGGFDDWCVPARDVLELAYRHLKPGTTKTICSFRDGDNPSSVPAGYPYDDAQPVVQTPVPAFQAGGAEAFEPDWHWSSTQYSDAYAWTQGFGSGGGGQGDDDKSAKARARAVRLIQLGA